MTALEQAQARRTVRTVQRGGCPVCGKLGEIHHATVRDRSHFIAGEWKIRSCEACQVGWLDPQPIDEDLGLCYPTRYYTHSRGDPAPIIRRGEGWAGTVRDMILAGKFGYEVPVQAPWLGRVLGSIGPIRQRLDYSADHSLPIWRSGGKLLDIGCGAGRYLARAAQLGWTTYGLEPDPAAAEVARQNSPSVVEVGLLETAKLPDGPFDAVTSMHSIEHARAPRAFLAAALRQLRPGGFFYLQTPNFGSLMHRRYGPDWYALEVPRHLCLLSVPALRSLLTELSGWQRLDVRTIARRARREQEQTIAMRRTGSFENSVRFSATDKLGIAGWAALERLGRWAFNWGEELEVIGIRANDLNAASCRSVATQNPARPPERLKHASRWK
jgi:2-polyprenyl-3-methyl-5-hydroxy-6-metoxy-1,4-benzoquinol methylase